MASPAPCRTCLWLTKSTRFELVQLLFCVNLILIIFVVYKPMQNPEEIIENERAIKYKLIELQNMAIYWDTDVTLVGDLPSKDLEASSNSSTYT